MIDIIVVLENYILIYSIIELLYSVLYTQDTRTRNDVLLGNTINQLRIRESVSRSFINIKYYYYHYLLSKYTISNRKLDRIMFEFEIIFIIIYIDIIISIGM